MFDAVEDQRGSWIAPDCGAVQVLRFDRAAKTLTIELLFGDYLRCVGSGIGCSVASGRMTSTRSSRAAPLVSCGSAALSGNPLQLAVMIAATITTILPIKLVM